MQLRNGTSYEFTDISSEEYRIYEFPDGTEIVLKEPLYLNVSASGGHRILDACGISHYIPCGWKHLSWQAKESFPHFVC